MKITIDTPKPHEEDEIIIRCHVVDDDLINLIYSFKDHKEGITAYQQREIIKLSPKDIYYFESVDNRVFACCEKQVYEVKLKLYEVEEALSHRDFIRISKSVIVNLNKINSVTPLLNCRLEASLQNTEKIIISRQYVPQLKKSLGI